MTSEGCTKIQGGVRALNVTIPTRMARLSDAASTRHTASHTIEWGHVEGAKRATAIQAEMPIVDGTDCAADEEACVEVGHSS